MSKSDLGYPIIQGVTNTPVVGTGMIIVPEDDVGSEIVEFKFWVDSAAAQFLDSSGDSFAFI